MINLLDPEAKQLIQEAPTDKVSETAINQLFDDKNLKQYSRLKVEQVPIISKLLLFSDVFQTEFTKNLANHILNLQVSIHGLGRKEIVALVQKRSDSEIDIPVRPKDIIR